MQKGQKMPEDARIAMTCSGNPMWKGSKVGRSALHEWVRKRKEKPERCEMCREAAPHDMANIGHTYRRALGKWKWLCRRCHMEVDGRIEALVRRNQKGRDILMGRWSLEHERCISCGGTSRKHLAKGMCSRCYQRAAKQN